MKTYCLIAAAFVTAIAASPSFAQQGTAQPRPAPTRTAPQTSAPASTTAAQANVPDSKVALINTEAFSDEKQGIFRIVAAMKRVDSEFQPRKLELQQLQQKIATLGDEIQKTIQVAAPKDIATKQEQLDQMKKEGQRKQEDAQAAYNKRMQDVLSPIYDDLSKTLDSFAKARGITLLLDVSKIGPAILTASEAMDVTRAFIAEFNTKYPATAAVTPPQ